MHIVQCLTSDLVGIGATSAEQIQTGWKARPVTSLSPRKISIRLMGKACQIQDIEAVQQQRFLRLCTDDAGAEACIFHVALNENKQYEILDGSLEKIISLPTIPLDTPGAHSWVICFQVGGAEARQLDLPLLEYNWAGVHSHWK